MRRSMAARIGAYITVLVIVVCGGLGVLFNRRGTSAVMEEVEEALRIHAKQAAKYIELKLDSKLAALEAIAARPEIRSMEWETQQPVLSSEVERLSSFEALAVFDATASGWTDTGSLVSGRGRDYVLQALQGHRAVSDMLINQATGQLTVVLAVPIKDNDRVVGALAGSIDGSTFLHIVGDMGFGQTGDAFLLDPEGTIIAHRNRDFVLNQVNVYRSSGILEVGDAIQSLGDSRSGVISYAINGQAKIGAVDVVPSTNWVVGVAATRDEVLDGVRSIRIYSTMLSVAFALGGAALGGVIARQLTRPLARIKSVVEAVADGDLTKHADVSARDEIGAVAAALNKTVYSVKSTLAETLAASDKVNTASQELAAMAEEVSASVEEVAGTTNHFSSTIEDLNQYAQAVGNDVKSVFEQAAEGNAAINDITAQMEQLRNRAKKMTDEISSLGLLSGEIGDIARTIKDIAEQTNLLALNAAIEAARAGEHGRGFAVVAEEVRKLAEQSGQAAAEIGALIRKAQSGISSAVNGMNESYSATNSAMESVTKSSAVLATILRRVEEITKRIEGFSTGLDQINTGGQEIASSTQEQAATVEQVARLAQNLTALAATLKELIGRFRLA